MKTLLIFFVVLLAVFPLLAVPVNKSKEGVEVDNSKVKDDTNRVREEDPMNKVRVVDNTNRVKREEDDVNRVWEE